MKGISAFVATILLIGFTVAVGAIISAFFMSYTRTTTSGVSAATACATGMLDISVPNFTSSSIIVMTRNLGNQNISSVTLSVVCGTNSNTVTISSLAPGSANVTSLSLTGCTDYSVISVSATGNCVGGGTTTAGCTGNGCKPY